MKENFPQVQVEEGDFLEKDILQLAEGKKIALVSNLPYHISSAIFFKLLEHRSLFEVLVLTFQKEFGDRLVAKPGNKVYGATSVLAQYCFDIKSLGNLPKGAFYPAPGVISQALTFVAKSGPLPVEYETFAKLVKASFMQRRKKLVNNLKKLADKPWDQLLTQIGLEKDVRAETLSVDSFVELAKAY